MTISAVYTDYTFKFLVSGLATALQALAALQAAGILGPGQMPANMLGDPRDATGAINAAAPVWVGRQGATTMTYTDPTTGQPATADPNSYYIAVRADPPVELPAGFSPTSYGMIATSAAESAAVLGVWA